MLTDTDSHEVVVLGPSPTVLPRGWRPHVQVVVRKGFRLFYCSSRVDDKLFVGYGDTMRAAYFHWSRKINGDSK